jgi:hypothetical protein
MDEMHCCRYFESRPHLLQGVGSTDIAAATAAAAPAAAALQRAAAKNPEATANLLSAGARAFGNWNNANNSSPTVSIIINFRLFKQA